MKLNKVPRLVMSLWLALSIFMSPLAVYAEGEATDNTATTLNTEPVATMESDQTTTVGNEIIASSESGDANADSNTNVGSLSTGSSSSVATIITTDSATSTPATDSFSINPNPNTIGDITLELETGSQITLEPTVVPLNSDLENVTNTITVTSLSGSSTANDNTRVEQINTGEAYSNANVINILGSNVSAPEIFLGYVTIDGSLTGDILLPSSFLQSLYAPAINPGPTTYLGSSADNKYGVENMIDAKAISGGLSATGNSAVGSAQSGQAANMLNSLDLVGLNIFGQSGLLVFVNVLGNWDGSILSQPPGVKAALIGSDSPGSSPYLIPLDMTKSITLTNNIKISATSGDITANGNTSVGDLATGNATTVVNLANILGSNLMFTKQFGILFITVLGDWFGSFGFDTPYGNPPASLSIKPAETPSNNSNTSVKSNFTYFSRIKSEDINSKLTSEVELSSMDNSVPLLNTQNLSKKDNSLANYMVWSIPLIGGSIALGLARTDKKIKR